MSAVEALLAQVVDYAGLFPPAGLEMEAAVANFQKYRGEGGQWSKTHEPAGIADARWMLGSFVVPAARLAEFTTVFERVCCGERDRPWSLSVLLSHNLTADLRAIEQFREGAVFISALEMKAGDEQRALKILQCGAGRSRYVEFAPEQADAILPALARADVWAKLRTGGVTADAIPSPESVAHFLLACRRYKVAFKATAGLHHAVRGLRKLTYDLGSPQARMHGFVNLLLAAAQAFHSAPETAIVRTLAEEDPAAFRIGPGAVEWHNQSFTTEQLARVRNEFMISFGSCSFTEPVDELKAMRWI